MFRPRNRRGSSSRLTLFFATDVHGSTVCFKKFINAAKFYAADVLILGGDVSGKMVVPIARQVDGSHLTSFAGKTVRLDSAEEIDAFSRRVADMGFYPKTMTEEEFAGLRADPERQHELFRQLITERIEEWVQWAQPRLTDAGVKCYAAPGNDDEFFVDDVIGRCGAIELLEMQVVEIDGLEMLSTGWSNTTPWKTERECSEEELKAKISEMLNRVKDPTRAIFNIHVPPYNSRLDTAPLLGQDLKVKTAAGAQMTGPVGSVAVREAIEDVQPLLTLHGHIHESGGSVTIGRTTAINVGSEYGEGILRGVLLTIGDGRLLRYQAVSG